MPEPNGNGAIEATLRGLGGLKLSGRDVLLASCLMALGGAAIVTQYLTFKAYAEVVTRDITVARQLVEQGRAERQEILNVVRAKTCAEALGMVERTQVP